MKRIVGCPMKDIGYPEENGTGRKDICKGKDGAQTESTGSPEENRQQEEIITKQKKTRAVLDREKVKHKVVCGS